MHEFIAMLAHELRNPLAPIRNAIELMGRRGLGDPALESMRQMIERQTGHLTRIVDDLLDVNRIAHGRLSIGKEPIDLIDVLSRAIETSRPLIDSRGHRLEVDIPAHPLEIEGDAVRLTQVMINLLNNAAKYTPRGGAISLTAAQRDAGVEISVRDTGKGIARQDLEKIFDLFAQLNPDSNGAEGGLGVGLALVRRVVELHGGTVRAKSEGLGSGSEFIVRLPLPLPMQGRLQVVSGGTVTETSPGIPRLRVLVVDDNRDAADSFHFLLEEMGQDVYTVYDGRTAIEAADRLRPHVVMLDIGMPGLSGYEVAPELKARLGADAPVIVAVTGWGQEEDKKQAKDSGIDYHFAKPVDQNALRKVLAKIAADRKPGR
jgi:CheY-like chemotaxis protein/two-component sensor histidine kinase